MMKDPIVAVSKKTGKKVEIPRARLKSNPDKFELPPSARKAQAPPKASNANKGDK